MGETSEYRSRVRAVRGAARAHLRDLRTQRLSQRAASREAASGEAEAAGPGGSRGDDATRPVVFAVSRAAAGIGQGTGSDSAALGEEDLAGAADEGASTIPPADSRADPPASGQEQSAGSEVPSSVSSPRDEPTFGDEATASAGGERARAQDSLPTAAEPGPRGRIDDPTSEDHAPGESAGGHPAGDAAVAASRAETGGGASVPTDQAVEAAAAPAVEVPGRQDASRGAPPDTPSGAQDPSADVAERRSSPAPVPPERSAHEADHEGVLPCDRAEENERRAGPPTGQGGTAGQQEASKVDPAGPRGSVGGQAFEPEKPSDLFRLHGAGPGLVWMLQQCGVRSLADLAAAQPDVLTERLGIVGQIVDIGEWAAFARDATADANSHP